jgi:hypothetical protein
MLSHFSYVLFLQLLSRGSVDVPALLAEVTQMWEIAAFAEASRAAAMLTAETSGQEGIAVRDSTTLHVKDVEDRAALTEREVLEMVSRAEAENSTVLGSICEDAKGLTWKIALLEDELAAERRGQEVPNSEWQEQFEELTLLQTRGSELCHAIIGPPWVRHHLFERMHLAALCHTEMAGVLAMLRVAVSIAVESVIWRSPSDSFLVEVVSELANEF